MEKLASLMESWSSFSTAGSGRGFSIGDLKVNFGTFTAAAYALYMVFAGIASVLQGVK